VAVDFKGRFIVSDTLNHRMQVFSSTGAFLFAFGADGNSPGCFRYPHGVIVDRLQRIIVSDSYNNRLQAFTSEGELLSTFGRAGYGKGCFSYACGIDLDEFGRIAIAEYGNHRVQVIGSGKWLSHVFEWRVDRHAMAPESMKLAIMTMTLIRTIEHESIVSALPNELLFEIFSWL